MLLRVLLPLPTTPTTYNPTVKQPQNKTKQNKTRENEYLFKKSAYVSPFITSVPFSYDARTRPRHTDAKHTA